MDDSLLCIILKIIAITLTSVGMLCLSAVMVYGTIMCITGGFN